MIHSKQPESEQLCFVEKGRLGGCEVALKQGEPGIDITKWVNSREERSEELVTCGPTRASDNLAQL